MTNEQMGTLVLKDQAGEYYLLPQETLEQGRVAVERLVEEGGSRSDGEEDTQGFLLLLLIAGTLLATGCRAAAIESTKKGTLNPGLHR